MNPLNVLLLDRLDSTNRVLRAAQRLAQIASASAASLLFEFE
jgi:hypothetical protein